MREFTSLFSVAYASRSVTFIRNHNAKNIYGWVKMELNEVMYNLFHIDLLNCFPPFVYGGKVPCFDSKIPLMSVKKCCPRPRAASNLRGYNAVSEFSHIN